MPDGPNHVGKNPVVSPLGQRFIRGLREAEIDGAREELLRPVDVTRRQKFLRAYYTQQVALFRPDQILAALSPGGRQIGGAHLAPAGEIGQQSRVFIIRMSAYHQDATQDGQLLQLQLNFRSAGEISLRYGRGEGK